FLFNCRRGFFFNRPFQCILFVNFNVGLSTFVFVGGAITHWARRRLTTVDTAPFLWTTNCLWKGLWKKQPGGLWITRRR
ncbi:MAG: hypothetical protein ACRDP7_25890, partial [Trebonia sp.]